MRNYTIVLSCFYFRYILQLLLLLKMCDNWNLLVGQMEVAELLCNVGFTRLLKAMSVVIFITCFLRSKKTGNLISVTGLFYILI